MMRTARIIAAVIPILLIGCKELIPPGLVLTDPPVPLIDTSYMAPAPVPQAKIVLLEEFTGVNCSNCPPGHDDVKTILGLYPANVAVLSIHNDNPLADPYPPPQEDYRTAEGIAISQLVGGSGAIPSGVIDRKDFDNDAAPIEFRNLWQSRVEEQLPLTTQVNLDVTITSYDDATRELVAKVKLHFTSAVANDLNITLALSESGIVAWQKLPNLTTDSNYVHDHVFRGLMTPAFGTPISVTTPVDRVIEKEFFMVLGDSWNPDSCEVVAFVHERAGFMEVLQAGHIDVK